MKRSLVLYFSGMKDNDKVLIGEKRKRVRSEKTDVHSSLYYVTSSKEERRDGCQLLSKFAV